MLKRVFHYLNPVDHLGDKHYSILFPFVANIFLVILSETYAYGVAQNPQAVGTYIIFLNVAFIVYFSFRNGIRGGLISAASAVFYYFYIVGTREFAGEQLTRALQTTVLLGGVYFLTATIIGWLKQRIDYLIEKEADAKRHLETILHQLPAGILVTDSAGKLIQRNVRLDKILGVKIPIGFQIGQDTLRKEKINGKPIDPAQSPLLQALKTGKPVIGNEFMYQRRDGKTLFLHVNSTPIFNSKKKAIAAATIVNDITRQKELERQKDDFLGIASHELKTPVTSIKAYGQVLQAQFNREGNTRAVEKLQKLDSQVNKLTNLIGDLLDVTKIQSGRLEYHRDKFDFNMLIDEIVEELRFTTEQHAIITKLDKAVTLNADRERIGQVITNLITNAIKYSPTSKKIVITTSQSKEMVTLCVKDFGVGIPTTKQKKVFEQFFRVSGAKQNTFPGLGLGLYISAEIIKREGGRIWVESEEGKGSTFCFKLPIKATKRLN